MDGIEQQVFDFSIVSPHLTVKAMRDSGYKSTDHAIAELIDNSIDANASLVELIVVETPPRPEQRYGRARVSEIAVADNGYGMDKTTLRRALRFGDGTRLDRSQAQIGRFGMGLPNASVSQCRRVDIWSWENGADNALHCFLDLDRIEEGQTDVPEPGPEAVPYRWREVVRATSEPTGTIVVWSDLDRVRWRGAETTLDKTAEICGRIYRKFLANDTAPIEITLALCGHDGQAWTAIGEPRACPPNDPLYLMVPSATPVPFGDIAMFRLFNENRWAIPVGDKAGEIYVRCAMAIPDAINERMAKIKWPKSYAKAGDSPWGKHADRNKGVSIVRAQRELELSAAWTNSYQPEERWWSVEVEFDPILDELFGVVNNKQHAHAFVSGAGFDWETEAYDNESYGTFRERLVETGDSRAYLIEVWQWIDEQIDRMRDERSKIMKGTGTSRKRHPETGEEVEDVATNVIKEQAEQGETGSSDQAPQTSIDEKIRSLVQSAMERQVDDSTAQGWAKETVYGGRRISMRGVTLGHRDAFFDVESVSDIIEVWLNDKHPVYQHLISVLDDESESERLEELNARLTKASFTLRMLLIAWARYEDKVPLLMKQQLEDMRMDWGREARKFLRPIES